MPDNKVYDACDRRPRPALTAAEAGQTMLAFIALFAMVVRMGGRFENPPELTCRATPKRISPCRASQ